MPLKFVYKPKLTPKYWKKYLGRKLTVKEKLIIREAKTEKEENKRLQFIQEKAKEYGLRIGKLTKMNGNCLFESLKYIGLYKNAVKLRKFVAMIMSVLENVDLEKAFNKKHVMHSTPGEIFMMTNEVEYVYCNKKEHLYQYNYQTMCVDMCNKNCWRRIHTELILRVLAIILSVKIRIVHSNQYVSEIDPGNTEGSINLGLMGEFHYIPLVKIEQGEDKDEDGKVKEIPCPKYKSSKRYFHKWASRMAFEIGNYYEVDEDGNRIESTSDND